MTDTTAMMEASIRRMSATNQVQDLGWVEQCWRTDVDGNHFDYRYGDLAALTLTFGAYGVLEEFALTTRNGQLKSVRAEADVEDFVRTLIHELVHLHATEENTMTASTVNASRDGIIDLALDSGWVLGKERHPDGGLTLSKPRNGSPIQFVLHFEDGDLERVEYSDGEHGTPDWIPDNPEERAFQLCRTIVGPNGHVPDPAVVKLEDRVERLSDRTTEDYRAIQEDVRARYRSHSTRIGAVEDWQRNATVGITLTVLLTFAALVSSVIALVPA